MRRLIAHVNVCYVQNMSERNDERFEMRAPKGWLDRVDNWRRHEPDLPSRAEAIRRLVVDSLKRRERVKGKNDNG